MLLQVLLLLCSSLIAPEAATLHVSPENEMIIWIYELKNTGNNQDAFTENSSFLNYFDSVLWWANKFSW